MLYFWKKLEKLPQRWELRPQIYSYYFHHLLQLLFRRRFHYCQKELRNSNNVAAFAPHFLLQTLRKVP